MSFEWVAHARPSLAIIDLRELLSLDVFFSNDSCNFGIHNALSCRLQLLFADDGRHLGSFLGMTAIVPTYDMSMMRCEE